MNDKIFKSFTSLIYNKSGITLNHGKEALVEARINKRMRALNITDHKEYLSYVINDKSNTEMVSFLDVITTNVTHFFRESEHFDILKQLTGKWISDGQTRMRFWSAASSTGEEPYSMAMVLNEIIKNKRIDLRILATDLSTNVLEKAKNGIYSKEKIKNVPKQYIQTYFSKINNNDYKINNNISSMILFKRLNLVKPPFPMKGPLDAVFCRNVMIYFDNSGRKKLLNEIYRLLKPGGYLFVGHSESLAGVGSKFKTVRPSIYIKA